MKQFFFPSRAVLLVLSILVASTTFGDVVTLKSGTTLTGKIVSSDGNTINFQTVDGINAQIPTASIANMTFDAAASPTAPAAPASTPATPAVVVPAAPVVVAAAPVVVAAPAVPIAMVPVIQAATVTIPTGTPLLVSLGSNVSSSQKAGAQFQGRLMQDILVNGVPVVPAGATVVGKVAESRQGGRLLGRANVEMQLTSLIINGKPYVIATNGVSETAQQGGLGKTAGRAAVGAGIGAIVDGGNGAAKGAGIGAASSLLKRSDAATVSSGAVYQFTLAQPVTL